MQKLHLIEPTLFDQTGHGFSYTNSLILANTASTLYNITLWADRRAKNLIKPKNTSCNVEPYFSRKIRQLQKLFLYKKLLTTESIIYICTAELLDLQLINFLKCIIKSKAKVFFHFHQFKKKPGKLKSLEKIANKNQDFIIFTPTKSLANIFNINFKNCKFVPCPTFKNKAPNISNISDRSNDFKKIIYAGAAREDKGFSRVVDLIEYTNQPEHINSYNNLKFEIQISTPNSLRHDSNTLQALEKLSSLPKHNLKLHTNTLAQIEYQSLFRNSICLLLYDDIAYQDKFSGITLDAFYAGCPIITPANTWMGDVTNKFDAGIVLEQFNNITVLSAIDKIKNNYQQYHKNALLGAKKLAIKHNPANTLLAIAKY